MKISRNWLQKYVSKAIPKGQEFIDLLSMNIFEVEGHEVVGGDEIFDVKTLPDRNAYCLSHYGIAREVAILLGADFKVVEKTEKIEETLPEITVDIQDKKVCRKYLARRIENIESNESPAWLKELLVSLGQRSINPIVDATNCVMLGTGQPLHAFDADLVKGNLTVRMAKEGEKITTLDNKEINLDSTILVIADNEGPLALAGVKGGNRAGVTTKTKNIILESANFTPTETRKTTIKVNIRNDSSKRFENNLPLEFAQLGMENVSNLIHELIPSAKFSPVFSYGPERDNPAVIETTTQFIKDCIGINIKDEAILSILEKCDISVTDFNEGKFKATAPTYRRDLLIPQDLAEEVGRIYGYDKIDADSPVKVESHLHSDKEFLMAEHIRQLLTEIGFDEIIGYTLREDGDFVLEMPLSKDKSTLRKTLLDSTREYIESNSRYLELLGIKQAKIFEVSRIFTKEGEKTVLSLGVINSKGAKVDKANTVLVAALKHLIDNGIIVDASVISQVDGVEIESKIVYDRKMELCVSGDLDFSKMSMDNDNVIYNEKEEGKKEIVKFKRISQYPFATRDIAIFAEKDKEREVYEVVVSEAKKAIGEENFVRGTLFDVFTKEDKTSYAIRLVFQSDNETLKDEMIDGVMKKVGEAVVKNNWVVR